MALNNDPLYTTPDTPDVDTYAVIPPSPQLQLLADLVENPVQTIQNNPKIQSQFRAPLLNKAKQDSDVGAMLARVQKNVANLPINKFDKGPILYDLKDAQRYQDPELGFIPGRDNESVYDANQSALGDVARNFLGFTGNLAGSGLSTLMSIPSTIAGVANGLVNGFDSESFSKFYDNPISQSITDWMDSVQEATYNYRNGREQALEKSPLKNMIPFYGNGLGDAFRSLGFGLGAAGGIFVEEAAVTALTAGTGTIPVLAARLGRLFKIGDKAKDALDLAKGLNEVRQVSRAVNTAGILNRAADVAWSGKLGARNIFSSLGEATFEAMETQKNLELELIEKFKREKGVDPTLEDLAQIKKATIEAGNARYLANVGLLTLTNAIEFDALFKTFPVSKYFKNEATRLSIELGDQGFQRAAKAAETIVSDAPWYKTFAGKAVRGVKTYGIIAPSEGFEEGMQSAIDKATGYYAEHKYNGRDESVGVLESARYGLRETLSTSEGWNAIIQGMVAGGIQQAATTAITNYRNKGKLTPDEITSALFESVNPYITNQEGKTNYEAVKTLLNINSIGGTLQNKIDKAAAMAGTQKAAKQAILNEDQLAFQTYKDDLQFTFLDRFISTNQFESLEDVLDSWTQLASTNLDAFKQQFGLDSPQADANTISESIRKLKKKAGELKKIHDDVNLTFRNPFRSKTSEYDQYDRYKTELRNQLFQYNRFQERYRALEDKNVGYTHLLKAFKDKEFKAAIRKEMQGLREQLSIPDPEGSSPVFKEVRENQQERLSKLEDLAKLSARRKELSQAEVLDFMFKTDDVFGTGLLRRKPSVQETLNDVSDMITLEENQRIASEMYQKLADPTKGFKQFQNVESELEAESNKKREASRKEKEAQQAKAEQQKETQQRTQQVRTGYGDQIEALAQATNVAPEILAEELASSGKPITDELVNNFTATKVAQTPVEEEEETTVEIDPDEFEVFDESFFTDEPQDPLETYRTGASSLQGKFIRYNSGSPEGTKDYRYIQRVTSLAGGRMRADVIEFENGVAVDKGNKEFILSDPSKFVEVVDSIPAYVELIKTLQAPPVVPPVPKAVVDASKGKPKPLAYFQQFFTNRNDQKRAILEGTAPTEFVLTRYSGTPGKGETIYDNGTLSIRSARSQNLSIGKNEVYSFGLRGTQGDLGFFRPLSSFIVNTNGREESLYDLVGRSLTTPNVLDTIAGAILGTPSDLILSYKMEAFLKDRAVKGKTSVSIKEFEDRIRQKVSFSPYFQGVTYAKTDDNELPTLGQLQIDRSQAFIWEDTGVSYLFNETNPDLDILSALNQFSNLFEKDGFTQSSLSSYLLFFKDSTGAWNTVPVRTIPVTSKGVETQVQDIEQRIQSFEGETEQLASLLNANLFYQSKDAKGTFVFSKGKLQFLMQSFGGDISYRDEQTDVRDAQQIRITLEVNPSTFTVEKLFEELNPKVREINQRGNLKLDFKLGDFRIQPLRQRATANDFSSYRVMVSDPSVFDTITMGYQASPETYEVPVAAPAIAEPVVEAEAEQTVDIDQDDFITLEDIMNDEPAPIEETPALKYDPAKMNKADAELFFKTYPDNKSQMSALRPIWKKDAKQILEQIQLKVAEKIDITSNEGANRLANQSIKGEDLFRQSGEEFVPSLKLEKNQLTFLVQKALRECR